MLIYRSLECLDAKCSCCASKTHFSNQCPRVHYMPDRDFLIKKLNFSLWQARAPFKRTKGLKGRRFYLTKVDELKKLMNFETIPESESEQSEEDDMSGEENDKVIYHLRFNFIDAEFIFVFLKEYKRSSKMLPRPSMMNESIMEAAENPIKMTQLKTRLSIMENIELKPRRGTVMKIVESVEKNNEKNIEKIVENSQKIEILDLFDYAFEVGKNYERYYPHNNLNKMMHKVNEGILPGIKKGRNKSLKKKIPVGVKETKKGASHFKMRKK